MNSDGDEFTIISIIDQIDEKLTVNQKINDYLLKYVQSVLKEFISTCDCKKMKLSECSKFISRGVSPQYVDSEHIVLGQTCVRNSLVTLNNGRTLMNKDYGDKEVQFGDVLVNSTGVGSLGRVGQVYFDCNKIVVDSHITIVRLHKKYREFVGSFLMTKEDEIENMAEGSTGQTELPRQSLKDFEVEVPDDASLSKFSEFACPVYRMIYLSIDENSKLTKIRDTLLPKLMSGEIDVSSLSLE